MSRIADQELLREARRILRRLASGARLVPIRGGRFAVTGTGSARNSAKLDSEMVEAFLARDWLRGDRIKGYALSEAGLGFIARLDSESPMPFADQHRLLSHRAMRDEKGIVSEVEVNDAESPLAWLRRRQIIDSMQFEAGERLRRDFTLAQLSPRLGVDLEAPVILGSSAPAEFSDMVVAAKQRFSGALKAVGPGLADLLFDVCCHLARLEGIERREGWPQRSAKVVLRIALDRLGEHYGMCLTAPSHRQMRSWQAV